MYDSKKRSDYFAVDEWYDEWCTIGPWFNATICHNLHGPLFEVFKVTEREDRYDIMCRLHDYGKREERSTGALGFRFPFPLTLPNHWGSSKVKYSPWHYPYNLPGTKSKGNGRYP